jgi:hypothetical protein
LGAAFESAGSTLTVADRFPHAIRIRTPAGRAGRGDLADR